MDGLLQLAISYIIILKYIINVYNKYIINVYLNIPKIIIKLLLLVIIISKIYISKKYI